MNSIQGRVEMASNEDFTLKLGIDDTDVKKQLDKLANDFKKPLVVDIKGQIDPSLLKTLSSLKTLQSKATGSPNDFLTRSQRGAAKAVNTFSTAIINATNSLSAFALKLSKQQLKIGSAIAGVPAGAGGSDVFGKLASLPGAAMLANYAMTPIRAGASFGKESLAAFDTQNRAELQLKQVLKNNGMGDNDFNTIKSYAGELQGKTTIGDEAMIAGAGELSTYVKDSDSMKRMMKLLADYSIGMNENNPNVNSHQIVDFATGLGKAFDGVYDSLRKKGFDTSGLEALKERENAGETITEADKITALENALKDWDGLAENIAQTDEGKLVQLNNTIGDLKENVGKGLYPALGRFADTVSKYTPQIERFFNSIGAAMVYFIDTGTSLLEILRPIIDGISYLSEIISNNMTTALSAITTATVYVGAEFLHFGQIVTQVAAKVTAAATQMQAASGQIGGLGSVVGSLVKGGLIAILAGEITLIANAVYQAWTELGKAKEFKKNEEKKQHDFGLLKSYYDRAKDYKGVGGEYERVSKESFQKQAKKYYDTYGTLPDYMIEMSGIKELINKRNNKPISQPQLQRLAPPAPVKITQINNVSTQFDELGKLIKENLREIAISRMTFKTSSEAAKAMAL